MAETMKWPKELVIIRHAESEYNVLKALKDADPLYQEFKKEYEENHRSLASQRLAERIRRKYALNVSDADTPLTANGNAMSVATGFAMKNRGMNLPDVILASPYRRPMQTYAGVVDGWPELQDVRFVPEDRLREQEHGLATLYNDYRVFHVMHPEQKDFFELEGDYWYRYPQGESKSDVKDRSHSLLGTSIREHAGLTVWWFTHHLTILSIRALLERWSPEKFMEVDEHEKPVNCGVTIYRCDPTKGKAGKLVLQDYNLKLY